MIGQYIGTARPARSSGTGQRGQAGQNTQYYWTVGIGQPGKDNRGQNMTGQPGQESRKSVRCCISRMLIILSGNGPSQPAWTGLTGERPAWTFPYPIDRLYGETCRRSQGKKAMSDSDV